jgi:hypothetical protein
MFNIYDWYWLADDGRIFSSRKQAIVTANDTDYAAWKNGNKPSGWPRDSQGNQTDASLNDVLGPYNIFVNLTYYTAYARWLKETGGITSSGTPLRTDRMSQSQRDAAWSYLQIAPGGATVQWKTGDGTFVTINKAQMQTHMNNTAGYVQDCFACEKTTVASITGGTITTRAQVDAAFAAISTVR